MEGESGGSIKTNIVKMFVNSDINIHKHNNSSIIDINLPLTLYLLVTTFIKITRTKYSLNIIY